MRHLELLMWWNNEVGWTLDWHMQEQTGANSKMMMQIRANISHAFVVGCHHTLDFQCGSFTLICNSPCRLLAWSTAPRRHVALSSHNAFSLASRICSLQGLGSSGFLPRLEIPDSRCISFRRVDVAKQRQIYLPHRGLQMGLIFFKSNPKNLQGVWH